MQGRYLVVEDCSAESRLDSEAPFPLNSSQYDADQQAVWGPFIQRVARRRAGSVAGADAADIEQQARMRLLRLTRNSERRDRNYVGKVLFNEAWRSAGNGATGSNFVPLEEAVTELENVRLRTTNRNVDEDIALEEIGRADTISAIADWADELDPTLRSIYDYLYVAGQTQRQTAVAMGISQPRVAQLHARLLALGRRDLEAFAA